MTPDIANIACRFVFDGAALFLWGSAAYLWLLVPERLSGSIWARLAAWRIAAVVLVVLATLVLLPVRCAMTWTSGKSKGLKPSMQATLMPNWCGLERR